MRIKVFILTLLLPLIGARSVFAVTVTISNTPPSITDQPFNIDVAVSGVQTGTNYLRANLFHGGTTKYFGYTNNGTNFINSSDYSQYFPITIDQSGNWSGSLQAKLDADSNYFSGPGTYSLKVRRYTQSGSSYTWSNEVILTVAFATPTPTPTPTPSPTPSNTSSTSKSKLTSTSSKTPSPTSNLTAPLPSVQDNSIDPLPANSAAKISYKIASVAAVAATPSAKVGIKNQKQSNYVVWVGLILIFAGVFSLGYIYLRKK